MIELHEDAFKETLNRYPECVNGLVFFVHASGLTEGKISAEALEWAMDVWRNRLKAPDS